MFRVKVGTVEVDFRRDGQTNSKQETTDKPLHRGGVWTGRFTKLKTTWNNPDIDYNHCEQKRLMLTKIELLLPSYDIKLETEWFILAKKIENS